MAEKAIRTKVRGGELIAEISCDPNNPGISVCYQPDGSDGIIDLAYIENTDPELRRHEGKENPDPNDIRVMVYEDPYQEDYTYEREFSNKVIRDALDLE